MSHYTAFLGPLELIYEARREFKEMKKVGFKPPPMEPITATYENVKATVNAYSKARKLKMTSGEATAVAAAEFTGASNIARAITGQGEGLTQFSVWERAKLATTGIFAVAMSALGAKGIPATVKSIRAKYFVPSFQPEKTLLPEQYKGWSKLLAETNAHDVIDVIREINKVSTKKLRNPGAVAVEVDLRTGEIFGSTSGKTAPNIDPITGMLISQTRPSVPESVTRPWGARLCAEPQVHYFASKGGVYSSPFEMSTVAVKSKKAAGTPKPMCHRCRPRIPRNVSVPTGR